MGASENVKYIAVTSRASKLPISKVGLLRDLNPGLPRELVFLCEVATSTSILRPAIINAIGYESRLHSRHYIQHRQSHSYYFIIFSAVDILIFKWIRQAAFNCNHGLRLGHWCCHRMKTNAEVTEAANLACSTFNEVRESQAATNKHGNRDAAASVQKYAKQQWCCNLLWHLLLA